MATPVSLSTSLFKIVITSYDYVIMLQLVALGLFFFKLPTGTFLKGVVTMVQQGETIFHIAMKVLRMMLTLGELT